MVRRFELFDQVRLRARLRLRVGFDAVRVMVGIDIRVRVRDGGHHASVLLATFSYKSLQLVK